MKSIEQEMSGKVAIVTGGNTGIGYGCAQVFVEAGMKVVIASRREAVCKKAADEINEIGPGECSYFVCDVSKPEQVEALVEFTVEKYGQLDGIVNNAGYVPAHLDACDMSMQKYFLTIDIGASSGRHILGAVGMDGKMTLEEIYRFDNGMKTVEGRKIWDVDIVSIL